MPQPIHEFGGSGPIMHLAVANGFPVETYRPLLRPFMESFRVLSLPPRALWPNEKPPATHPDWSQTLAVDLLNGLRENAFEDVIAVGHSFGGIASILAILEEPQRFRALILLDPTIMVRPLLQAIDEARENNALEHMPLSSRALKRRREFDDAAAAYAYFKEKPLFADWDDEALRLYAEHGTQPTETGVTWRWSPEWEAFYFRTIYTGIWEDLPELKDKLPILAIQGQNTDTFVDESANEVRDILPDMRFVQMPGHGHLFPQSNPGGAARMMRDFINDLD